ncbi:hypothetical protein [Alistipes shahii]|uniref:hypothetical protein n=1 Tax=Alistipes putredinis TaxID=28117 RepID=UPI00266666C2|nr:hypothetical protein [Alistipes shahii]
MTKQEFEARTGLKVSSEDYARIEKMYMAAGNMDKDMFCAEYKKVGTSVLVAELFRQVLVLKGQLEERNNELDDATQRRADVAEFLVGKAAVHKDDDGEDFYRVALRIAGRNACVRTKLEYGYPLNGEDISFLKSLL